MQRASFKPVDFIGWGWLCWLKGINDSNDRIPGQLLLVKGNVLPSECFHTQSWALCRESRKGWAAGSVHPVLSLRRCLATGKHGQPGAWLATTPNEDGMLCCCCVQLPPELHFQVMLFPDLLQKLGGQQQPGAPWPFQSSLTQLWSKCLHTT